MNQRKETPFFIGFLGIPAGLRLFLALAAPGFL